jgi:hypothetical protein
VGDSEGMAANIVALMSDVPARAEMGKAARKRIKEKFELNHSVNQTGELLSSLIRTGYHSELSVGQV